MLVGRFLKVWLRSSLPHFFSHPQVPETQTHGLSLTRKGERKDLFLGAQEEESETRLGKPMALTRPQVKCRRVWQIGTHYKPSKR